MGKSSPTLIGKERRVVQVPVASCKQSLLGPRPQAVRILRQGYGPAIIALDDTQRYLLGRHGAADIGFDDEVVSRLHGVLVPTRSGWSFEDYGSSNGTSLLRKNEPPRQLGRHQSTPVCASDVIELGGESARIELLLALPKNSAEQTDNDPICRSKAAQDFNEKLRIAARTRVPVFLLGPSGCGKTHSARQIHLRCKGEGAFVPINCARLPTDPSALHSELLGHVKGAFTGADSLRKGKLVHADGGTLFLDEVESLSSTAQGFLLDVLEGTGDLAPLGAAAPRLTAPVFRLISASKVPLGESSLRGDLCERLAEGHLWRVPTLEERRPDIPGLVANFAAQQTSLLGVDVHFNQDAVTAASAARWPGQIRQLRATVNVLAQMAVAQIPLDQALPTQITLTRKDLEQHLKERAAAFGLSNLAHGDPAPAPLRQKADARALTRDHIEDILQACAGNQSEAARRLGVARNTLARKVKEFGIK